jgi:hypothetical protein
MVMAIFMHDADYLKIGDLTVPVRKTCAFCEIDLPLQPQGRKLRRVIGEAGRSDVVVSTRGAAV